MEDVDAAMVVQCIIQTSAVIKPFGLEEEAAGVIEGVEKGLCDLMFFRFDLVLDRVFYAGS